MNTTMIVFIVLGNLLVFPLFWMAVVWLISGVGWANLAQYWVTTQIPTGQVFSLVTARIGLASYRNCLSVWLADSGLFLEPIWLFRVGHRRLLIPWQAIENIQPTQVLWLKGAKLELLHGKTIVLYGSSAMAILEQFLPSAQS